MRVLPKFDENLTIQSIKIGDPVDNIIVEVIIWKRQIEVK